MVVAHESHVRSANKFMAMNYFYGSSEDRERKRERPLSRINDKHNM